MKKLMVRWGIFAKEFTLNEEDPLGSVIHAIEFAQMKVEQNECAAATVEVDETLQVTANAFTIRHHRLHTVQREVIPYPEQRQHILEVTE